ncbi:hypothetical protein ACE6H2_002549 [Prunus campanulata]
MGLEDAEVVVLSTSLNHWLSGSHELSLLKHLPEFVTMALLESTSRQTSVPFNVLGASGGSVSNSRRITETKCLLCLAKLVEKEQGELQFNCLMTVIEITVAAESNANLRRAAFKTDLPTAKAVVDQLLRLIKDVDSPTLQIPAIKSAMNTHSCMD